MKKKFLYLLPALLGFVPNVQAMEVETGTPDLSVDSSQILTTIGEGSKRCHIVTSWNDNRGVDNLTFSLCFNENDNLTASTIMDKIFSAGDDWRFYIDETGAYCFDLNGDKVRTGDPVAYDHCQKDGADGEWVVTAPNATVEDGDLISIAFRKKNVASLSPAKLFYLPAKDTVGVWAVPDQEFALADATYTLPLYINLCGGTFSSFSVTYYKEDNKTRDTSVCSVTMTASLGQAGGTDATLTTKKEGNIHVAMRLYYTPVGSTKKVYSDYSYNPLTVTPAVKVIESVKLKKLDTPLQLSHSYDLNEFIEIVPSDATYTGGFTFKYVSPSPAIAGVSGTKLTTRTTPGTFNLSVVSKAFSTIKDECEYEVALLNPVTSIEFENIDPSEVLEVQFDPYKMEYNTKCALLKVEPADADIPTLALKILESDVDTEDGKVEFEFGAGNPMRYDLVTTYQQNDGAYDIYVWGYGEATVVFEATDGSGVQSAPLKIKSVARYMDITDNYQEGTLWLNEDWFGHSNGSINYLDADGDIHYRVYNYANSNTETPRENCTFGCTSQYGMIFGDRLYIMSKQATDGGDRYQTGGGRLVIADAKNLKRIYSFDVIGADEKRGGDGRACVGVSSDKVYLGHHAGIRVLNIDNSAETPEEMFKLGKELVFSDAIGDLTPGNPQGALYSNQVGDMVCAGGHVFAVMQDRGLLVVDTATDTHVATLGDEYVEAVTQSADGNVWFASNNTTEGCVTIHCVDPESLEELGVYELPKSAGMINTGWGAWRSANFFASREKNVLYWSSVGSGYQDDILGAGTGNIYRWEIGTPLPTTPFFVLGDRPGKDSKTMQVNYATMRYDDRHDRILFATTHGASYNYRYNWIYFVNGTTGEIERVQEMDRYFWFPAIPIFPDKEDAEINIEKIAVSTLGEYEIIDLDNFISDADNLDKNIRVSVVEQPDVISLMSDDDLPAMEYELEGKQLKIKLNKNIPSSLTLAAESNGKITTKTIPVELNIETAVENLRASGEKATLVSGDILIKGMNGRTVYMYTLDGRLVWQAKVTSDYYRHNLSLEKGVYVIKANNGFTQKVINR